MCKMEMEQINRRKKLWDLPHNVHCQLIGLCFDDQELEKIGQRFGYQIEATTTPYELHRFFVCIAEQDLPLTRKLNQQLDKKFQVQVKQFKLLENTDEILVAWQVALQGSQMAGAFWAVITHKLTDLALLELVYGDLHMQAHKQNHFTIIQRQQIERLKQQLQQLQEKSEKTQQKALKSQQKQQQKLLNLQQENHKLKIQNSAFNDQQRQSASTDTNSLHEENTRLKHQLNKAENESLWHKKRCSKLTDELQDSNTRNITQHIVSESTQHDLIHLEQQSSATQCANSEQCLQTCKLSLSGQCVLYVGGRGSLIPHYRDLVSNMEGEFVYHDGGLKDTNSSLPTALNKADIVVCPEDCISHNAYWSVKRYCKKINKQLMIMPSAGVSTLARTLETFAQ